jgi:hypothetical protein
MSDITRTPLNNCMNCGKLIDSGASIDPGERSPQPGDIAICLDCAHIHIYTDDLTIRNPTDDEVVEIAGDPDIIRAVNMIAYGKRRFPR